MVAFGQPLSEFGHRLVMECRGQRAVQKAAVCSGWRVVGVLDKPRGRPIFPVTMFIAATFQGSLQWDARLPTHLAHALLDERAVAKHVIGPSFKRQRQNCGKLCRFLPVDIPG